jgi:hypothetical protein
LSQLQGKIRTCQDRCPCICCGGPLDGREGEFPLKYFLVERPGERKRYSSYSS